jgi:hypothetical protein
VVALDEARPVLNEIWNHFDQHSKGVQITNDEIKDFTVAVPSETLRRNLEKRALLVKELNGIRYELAQGMNLLSQFENIGPKGAIPDLAGFQPVRRDLFEAIKAKAAAVIQKLENIRHDISNEMVQLYMTEIGAAPIVPIPGAPAPPPGGSGKPKKRRKLRGGARSTASAILDVATNPKATIEEFKGIFGHIAALFSDIHNLGGNLRIHGKAIYQFVVKYLPLAGTPGYAAATFLERVPIDKIIEVAASILDFFSGKGDLMHMLDAMASMVGDIFNQLKDLIPQIIAKVGHEISDAIGSNTTAATLANMFGANYESPAVRQAREAWEREKARADAANAEKDRQNTVRQAAQDNEKATAEAGAKAKTDAQFTKAQEDNKKAALQRLQFTPAEIAGYGSPQIDMSKIAPVTLKDKQYIDAFLAKAADELEKTGIPPPAGTPKVAPLDQAALDKLLEDALATHKNNDALWAMADDAQLKAAAYGGDKASQQKILKYYNVILNPDGGQPTAVGLQYLADKGVRMAKEELNLPDQEGYDPRDTATKKYTFSTGGSKPLRGGNKHLALAFMEARAKRSGKRSHTETLDPFFFEREGEDEVGGETVLKSLLIDGVKFTAVERDFDPETMSGGGAESGYESPSMHGSGMLEGNAVFKRIAEEAYKSDPAQEVNGFKLIASSPTLKFYADGPDVIVGIRGTQDFTDAKADAAIVVGDLENSQRFKTDLAFFQKVKADNPDKVFYGAGHSLGGAILDVFISKGLIRSGKSINAALQLGKEETANERIYNRGDALYMLSKPFLKQSPLVETRTKSVLAHLSPLYNLLEQHKISGYGKPHGKTPRRERWVTFPPPPTETPSSSSSSSSSSSISATAPETSGQSEWMRRLLSGNDNKSGPDAYDESRESIAEYLTRLSEEQRLKESRLLREVERGAFPIPHEKIPKISKIHELPDQKYVNGVAVDAQGFRVAGMDQIPPVKRPRVLEGPPPMYFDYPYEAMTFLHEGKPNEYGTVKVYELYSDKEMPGTGHKAYGYAIVNLDMGDQAYISLFEAVPQRLGLGKYLYKDVVEPAMRRKGMKKIILMPADSDAAAFWASMGYTRIGKSMKWEKKLG